MTTRPRAAGRGGRGIPYPPRIGYTGGMKTAISLSDSLFYRAEAAAQQRGVSRSQLYAQALERYLDEMPEDPITAQINQVVDSLDADTAAAIPNAGRQLIDAGQWEW